ncbi:CPBP family intramembrane glutamic endopeptidase [Microlunatus ginsengisoli]|uniref:CAAX prenyl protease 2/Lysostaphin resistance protein A-like domain-containing protein n=1 Tax=Microlunatus ginsengisoli TaxID=363863 RepID=A0ABP7APW7_9ACTN
MSDTYPPPIDPDDPVGAPYWSPIPQQPVSYPPVPGAPPPVSTGYAPVPAGYEPVPAGYAPVPAGYAPAPAGYAPAPIASPLTEGAMPDGERTYPQMLRGPRRRWWRPLLSLLLAGVIAIAAQVLAVIPFLAFGLIATGGRDYPQWLEREFTKLASMQIDAAGFFYTNLGLIALIPAAGLSIWAVHHIRPKFVSSVAGGFRWRWLLRCLIVVVPVWVLYIGSNLLLEQPANSDRPAEWVLLLVLVVVMTPFQAAGEEYFFRGWILQNVGSWFPRPVLSLIGGTIVSVVAFSAAHGSPDPWILASLAIFALSCCLLTWRTGGLEAAIAVHAVNNIAAFFAVISFGGWDQAFIGADSKGSPGQFAVDAAVQVVAFALLWWQAGRAKIVTTYRPAGPGAATAPALPVAN